MRFQSPLTLLALAAVPAAVALWWWIERSRRASGQPFAREELVAAIAPNRPGWRRQLPPALLLVAVALLLVAAARPHARIPVRRERATVVLAIDASRSMDATDVPPSRLAAAQRAARLFLERLPEGFRAGAVAFAGTAKTIAPPSADVSAVATSISSLETSRGTVIGDGLAEALRSIRRDATGSAPDATIVVLLSDGNDTGSDVSPQDAAARAKAAGVQVDTIALGDVGAPPTNTPRPPNVALLRGMAQAAGGRFYPAPSEDELDRVYEDVSGQLAWMWRYREVTVAFVAVAALLAAACGAVSAWWFRRIPS
jgi:Ca-activated chloride channel homolog